MLLRLQLLTVVATKSLSALSHSGIASETLAIHRAIRFGASQIDFRGVLTTDSLPNRPKLGRLGDLLSV
jgi:hypothetical protein